jgi:class 3 adenylate cyclase
MSALAHEKTTSGFSAVPLTGRRNAVILCSELRGLARMSEALEPRLVLQLAGEFFDLVAHAVEAHGGEAISAQHDELLSVFPRGNPLHAAQQAVRAAQRVQGLFIEMADRWRTTYGLRAAAAQGMHLGEVILGLAGPKGMERRTAFGDSVSIAHSLQQRARAGEFVMSDAVMGALSVENLDLDAEPLPQLELSRRPPIRIYGVLVAERLDFT